MTRRPAAVAVLLACVAGTVEAQPRDPGHFEIGIGGAWSGGYDTGSADATLTANQVPAGSVTLFTFDSEARPLAGVWVTLGYRLSRLVTVEGGFSYGVRDVEGVVRDDVEVSQSVTLTESLDEFVFGGSLLVHPPALAFARTRARLYLLGGAGHVRHLHENDSVVDTGLDIHGGGGVRWALLTRARGALKTIALRGEGRLVSREGGADFDGRRHTFGAVRGSVVVGF